MRIVEIATMDTTNTRVPEIWELNSLAGEDLAHEAMKICHGYLQIMCHVYAYV